MSVGMAFYVWSYTGSVYSEYNRNITDFKDYD